MLKLKHLFDVITPESIRNYVQLNLAVVTLNLTVMIFNDTSQRGL